VTFLETTAHFKLSRGNHTQSFCFGGYGCNSPHRGELTHKAIERSGARSQARSHERAPTRRRSPVRAR
jgi:hypothetical protein